MESVINHVPWLIESFDYENVTRIRDICHLNCLQFHSQIDDFIGCVHCMKRLIREGIIGGYEDLIQILFDLGVNFKSPITENGVYSSNALHIACEYGQLIIVKFLLLNIGESFKTSASKRHDGTTYENAFSFAARTGHAEIIKCLQDVGNMNINENLPDGGTALSALAFENNYQATKILCECGADVNLGSFDGGFKAIHYASQRRESSEMLRLLLKYGANIEEPLYGHKYGERPLFLAVKYKCEENIKILLEAGANVFRKGKLFEGHTNLIGSFCLSAIKCPELIPEFLKHGADPNEICDENGDSVFVIAIDHGASDEVLERLIRAGTRKGRHRKTAVQSCKNFDQIMLFRKAGWTLKEVETDFSRSLLDFAFEIPGKLEHEINELCLDLLTSGANPNLILKGEDSLLIKATRKGWRLIVKTLLKFGSNVNHTGLDRNTAVHVCCMNDCRSSYLYHTLKLLIEEGANLNMANRYMDFPLEIILKRLNTGQNYSNTIAKCCVSLMLDNGADPNLTAEGRDSPLILAVRQSLNYIVENLLEAGANILHKGVNGATAFDECLKSNHPNKNNIMRKLIDKGLPLNVRHLCGKYPFELLIQSNFDNGLFLLMLSNGSKPNVIKNGEDSFLMTAIKHRRFDLAISLIDSGADYSYKNTEGWRALDFFLSLSMELSMGRCNEEINESATDVFKRLLTFEKKIDQKSVSGIYPIEMAVKLGSAHLVKQLIKDGADVNVMKDCLDTPLTIALYNDYEDIVVLLLESNADVNHLGGERKSIDQDFLTSSYQKGSLAKYTKISNSSRAINDNSTVNCFGDSILTRIFRDMRNLSEKSMKKYVSLLMKFGADPNMVGTGRDSPLMHAIKQRKFGIALMLVEGGADVKFQGSRGLTSLHLCLGLMDSKVSCAVNRLCSYDLHKMLQALLNSGASPSTLSDNLLSPLHLVLQSNHHDRRNVLLQLLEYTKEIDVTDVLGRSPLIIAAAKQFCDLKVIEKMVSIGADTTLKSSDGITFLHILMGRTEIDTDITSCIVEHGADINAEDDHGETPLSVFIRTQLSPDLQKVRFLIEEMGSNPNSRIAGGDTILMHVIRYRRYSLAECLIQAGAIVNLHGNGGVNPLHLAVGLCIEEETYYSTGTVCQDLFVPSDLEKCISILLDAGANVSDETYDGKTPLSILLSCKNDTNSVKKIFNLLIAANANPNCGRPLPLISAVKLGDISIIKCLLNKGAEINQIDDYGESALTTLLNPDWFNSTEDFLLSVTDILLEQGADVNFKNGFGRTSIEQFFSSIEPFLHDNIFLEIKRVHLTKIVSMLLRYGSDPNTIPEGIDSVLMKAVEINYHEMVKDLLTYNSNVNHRGAEGKNVLHTYLGNRIVEEISKIDTSMITCMVKHGADINAVNNRGETPLSIFLLTQLSPELQHVRFLIEEMGSNPNSRIAGGDTILMHVIRYRRYSLAECLIQAGAIVNLHGNGGVNPLHLAVGLCTCLEEETYFSTSTTCQNLFFTPEQEKCISSLLEAGASVNDETFDGKTPLSILLSNVNDTGTVKKILNLLMVADANPNCGRSIPLILAVKFGDISIIECLLDKGAEINQIDDYGESALTTLLNPDWFTSTEEFLYSVTQILLEQGADVNFKNRSGRTPLVQFFHSFKLFLYDQIFLERKRAQLTKIVSVLLRYGADPNTIPEGIDSVLIKAIEINNLEMVKDLLIYNANFNHHGAEGKTVIHAYFGNSIEHEGQSKVRDIGILAELLDKNVKLSHEEECGALVMAIIQQNVLGVRLLLNARENMLQSGNDWSNAVDICMQTCFTNNLEIIDILLDHAKDDGRVASFFERFWHFIHYQYIYNKDLLEVIMLKVLSHRGINFNFCNRKTISPLIFFCKRGALVVVEKILENNADINHVDTYGMTALHYVCDIEDDSVSFRMLECLLKKYPRLDVVDCNGQTALQRILKVLTNCRSLSCSLDNYATYQTRVCRTSLLVQRFLEEDINPDVNDLTEGLLVLAKHGDFKGMVAFLRKGANVCAKDDKGNTVVHLCWSQSSDGALDFIQVYVKNKGPIVTNNAGQLPLMILLNTGETTFRETSFGDSITAKLVPYLIQNERMVNCVDDNLNTPIMLAARKGYTETIQVLMNCGANLFHLNEDKDSVFHICLNYYQDNIVDVISKLTTVGNVTPALLLNNENTTPLYLATRIALEKASSTLCKILLEHGADPNVHSRDYIPLISAVEELDKNTVEYFLKVGAKVNVVDSNGRSPLHHLLALHKDSYTKDELWPIANMLLEHRINVNQTDSEGRSALFYAFSTQIRRHWFRPRVIKTEKDVVLMIIDFGSDVSLVDVKGDSLLSRFCRSDSDAIIGHALLEAGADPNIAFSLENAVRNKQCEKKNESWLAFIALLIKMGANPNSYKRGTPILARIIKKRCLSLVEEMIHNGADVNAADENGMSVLHYACSIVNSEEREKVVRLIVKHGAKLNKTTVNGTTPLVVLIESIIDEMGITKVKRTKIRKTHYMSMDMSLLNFFVRCGASLSCRSQRLFGISPLLQLLKHGFISTVTYLIQSGWNIEREDWLKKDLFQIVFGNIYTPGGEYEINNKNKMKKFRNFVESLERGPKSLEFLCRNNIRNHILSISNGTEINSLIPKLHLPKRLISFLACYDFQEQKEIIDLKRTDLDSDNSDNEDSSNDVLPDIETEEKYNDSDSDINSGIDVDMYDGDDTSDYFSSDSDTNEAMMFRFSLI